MADISIDVIVPTEVLICRLTNICLIDILRPVGKKSIRNNEKVEFQEQTSFRWRVVWREPSYPGKSLISEHCDIFVLCIAYSCIEVDSDKAIVISTMRWQMHGDVDVTIALLVLRDNCLSSASSCSCMCRVNLRMVSLFFLPISSM